MNEQHPNLIRKLTQVKIWAEGLALECQQTIELLEKEGVSTPSTDNRLSAIATAARRNLRAKINKRS